VSETAVSATTGADTGAARAHLLERDAEVRLLGDSIRAAAGGRGTCVLVEAPAGMGKTSLLQACAAEGIEAGFAVLTARASSLESQYAFGVARQLLESPLQELEPEERAAVLTGPASNAAPLFSELASTGAGDPADAGAMEVALQALIANLARRRPHALLVDDVQWCDEPSLRFLSFLSRRVTPLAAIVVLASRTPGQWVVPSLRAPFLRDPSILRMRPRPLSAAAVEELLSSATAQPVDGAFASACRRMTGGNPFYLTELVREMLELRIAPAEENIGQARAVASDAIDLSVRERIERLEPLAGEVARAVAVLGDGCSPAWAAELTGATTERVIVTADLLRGAGLLAPERGLAFLHPILSSAVYESIPVGQRDILHGRAAVIAHKRHADAEVIAAHLALTSLESDLEVGPTFRAAAGQAMARGAPEIAAAYLRRALETELDADARRSLLLELGRAEARARRPSAAACLAEVIATTRDPNECLNAALALWSTDSFDGKVSEGLDMLRRARAGSDGATPDLMLRLDLELARAARSSRSTAAEGHERIVTLAKAGSPVSAGLDRIRAGLVAYDAMLSNQPCADVVEMLARALPIAEPALEGSESQLLHVPLYTLIFCDEIARAREVLADVAASAERRGATVGAVVPIVWGGYASLRAGELDAAERLATISLARATEHSWHFGRAASQLWLGEIALERGDVAAAGRLFGGIAGVLQSRPDFDDKGWADQMTHGRALWKLAAGNASGALADLLEIGRRHDEFLAICPAELPWRSNAARCAHALGDAESALRLASSELELARAFGGRRALGIALRIHGEVSGSGDSLAEAVSVLEAGPAALELARARVALGAWLRRAGRQHDALQLLQAGLEDAMRLTATAVEREARDELLAAGGRPPARPAVDDGTLSTSELRVVRFAAQGLSNPEIARALYVSRRTVEAHLYHAYRKLGIRSRAELVASFDV
jgi:DNA-binding CsgD family transcriptional regulator